MTTHNSQEKEPIITMTIREFITNSMESITKSVTDIEKNVSDLTESVRRDKEFQRNHFKDCPNTKTCRQIDWCMKNPTITITTFAAFMLLSSAGLSTAYETLIKPKPAVTTPSITLKDIQGVVEDVLDGKKQKTEEPVLRGGNAFKYKNQTPAQKQETIKDMNK